MGAAGAEQTIALYLHPSMRGHPEGLDHAVADLLAHEYHHHARLGDVKPRGPGSRFSVADGLVLEGLAERFRIETVGGTPAPWSVALQEADVEAACLRLHPVLASTSQGDYDKYMLGSDGVPQWLGYSAGFHLVGSAMQRTGCTAAELTAVPSRDILSAVEPKWCAALGI